MTKHTFELYDIEKDGLPKRDEHQGLGELTGRVAFIFDGCVVDGWPLKGSCAEVDGKTYGADEWEADSDVGKFGVFTGVKKYIVFDRPVWEY